MYLGDVLEVLESGLARRLEGKVDLVFTSPPFPLNRKKKYGNLTGGQYIQWLASLAPIIKKLLAPNGSVVLEIGNAWEPGKPMMSTLALKALLKFLEVGDLHLCQQFVCYNPARLPSPAQWVNIERIRVKDAFTQVWWMSKTERPKANNRRILIPYSKAMKNLLRTGKYNAGRRPSEHSIGATSFNADNGGAIPSNVLTIANTSIDKDYRSYCLRKGLPLHPARMQRALPEFFIKFLTRQGDTVFDPFAGSNMTGAAAESLGRRWIAIERSRDYVKGSRGRFLVD